MRGSGRPVILYISALLLLLNRPQFLVEWICLLDSIPEVELLEWLPHFLDGLVKMLSDRAEDIRQSVDTCIAEFLQEIRRTEQTWKVTADSLNCVFNPFRSM